MFQAVCTAANDEEQKQVQLGTQQVTQGAFGSLAC